MSEARPPIPPLSSPRRSVLASAAVPLVLAGCAGLAPQPPAPTTYACDGGEHFHLTVQRGGETAVIELARMRFALIREPAESGTRYGCSVLTFSSDGDLATVEMPGELKLTGCRVAAR